jgi:DNA (cytosine-5)-methyltransferase 1
MTKYEQWNIQSGTVDLLVGGTPCQSFSVAGLRQGLKDPRGNLMLTYLAIAERFKPRWLVWENVPGVLSSNGGKDFGSFLGALGELGYVDWAYRILDAQWFGVAQRRRRVFVIAHLGEGNLAAKVLFESESVRRDTPPSRETRQGVATNVAPSLTASNDPSRSPQSSEVTQQVNAVLEATTYRMQAFGEYSNDGTASAMKARDYKDATDLVASPVIIDRAAFNQGQNAQYKPRIEHGETMDSLVARGPHAVLFENHPNDSRVTGPHDVAPSCVSRYGTGGGNVPLVQEAIPIDLRNANRDPEKHDKINRQGVGVGKIGDPAHTMTKEFTHGVAIAFEPGIATREGSESRFVKELSPTLRKEMGDNQVAVAAFKGGQGSKAGGIGYSEHVAPTLPASDGGNRTPTLLSQMAVRRLSPRECERLQGFPDDHTLIPWRNKPADQCPDGPRYKALGNSMAVPCMAWIGKRIDAVERNMK